MHDEWCGPGRAGRGWSGAWSSTDRPGPRRGPGPGPRFGSGPGGPPPWVQDLVRSFGGPDFGPPRGPKVRRGDVRSAILAVLADEPMNGYQVIQQISERSGGAWRPSPGSVYPTVQQLEDEGLVEGREVEGRRLLHLTTEGREHVAARKEELEATWRAFDETDSERAAAAGSGDLKPVIGQVMGAVWQVMTVGTEQQRAEAAEVLGETRRRLYGLLAEGEPQ